jgi:hypothetical protein
MPELVSVILAPRPLDLPMERHIIYMLSH